MLDLGVQVLQEADSAAGAFAVARQLDEVERVMRGNRPREIADERDARLQRPDEQRLLPGVVLGDLGADLPDTRTDLGGVEKDLADALVV